MLRAEVPGKDGLGELVIKLWNFQFHSRVRVSVKLACRTVGQHSFVFPISVFGFSIVGAERSAGKAAGRNIAALPFEEVGPLGHTLHSGVVAGGRRGMGELVNRTLIFQFQPPFGPFPEEGDRCDPERVGKQIVDFPNCVFGCRIFGVQVRRSCQLWGP